jgi:putative endonuclease
MIFVYVLRSLTNGKRYVGITDNPPRRFKEHGQAGSTVWKLLGKFEVLHEEEFADYSDARVREKFLKSGRGRGWLDEKYIG